MVVGVFTAGGYIRTTRAAKTGLRQGGAISPAFYMVYINELPKRIREQSDDDELDLELCIKLVADDVAVAETEERAMQKCLNVCTTWARTMKHNGHHRSVPSCAPRRKTLRRHILNWPDNSSVTKSSLNT